MESTHPPPPPPFTLCLRLADPLMSQTFPAVTTQPCPPGDLAGASAYATAIAVGGPSAVEAATAAAVTAKQAVDAAGLQVGSLVLTSFGCYCDFFVLAVCVFKL